MPAQGDASRHQAAHLAAAAGPRRYDTDPVAQGAADRDGMAGQPLASVPRRCPASGGAGFGSDGAFVLVKC